MNPQEKRDIIKGLKLLRKESRTAIKKLRIDLLIEKVMKMK